MDHETWIKSCDAPVDVGIFRGDVMEMSWIIRVDVETMIFFMEKMSVLVDVLS